LAQSGNDWALIDCNLTQVSRAKNRLLEILDRHNVRQLKFVCLTHYDADHLRGMADLLKTRFCRPGKEADDPSNWLVGQLVQPFRASLVAKAMGRLEAIIERIHKSKVDLDFSSEAIAFLKLTRRMLLDGYDPRTIERTYLATYSAPSILRTPKNFGGRALFGPFEVCFLAPEYETIELLEEKAFETFWSANWNLPEEMLKSVTKNDASLVIVFRHLYSPHAMIFAGDTTTKSWPQVFRRWMELCSYGLQPGQDSKWKHFHIIKVSHHGSLEGHSDELYSEWVVPKKSIPVISCLPNDDKHPCGPLLSCLASSGLNYQRTGKGSGVRRPLRRGVLPGRPVSDESGSCRDIRLVLKPGSEIPEIHYDGL